MKIELTRPVTGMAQMIRHAEKLKILFFMLLALDLSSCREKPVEEAVLVISASELPAPAEGGEATVQITSDQKWSIASINQLWVNAAILGGVPGVPVNVKFTFDKNTTATVRTATVAVVSGSTRETITIVQ